jgi:COP9 signalosome complex subunit 6
MEFLGWYTTGGDPDEADIQLHQQICEINESPIFLKLNPTSKEAEVSFFSAVMLMYC